MKHLFTMELSDKEIEQLNQFYSKACKKMEGLVIFDEYRPLRMSFFEKIRANKSIKLFSEVLRIYPDHSPSLFFIGKLYQRMKKYEQALEYMEKALLIDQSNHSIAQEASLIAMSLNQVTKAVVYSTEALRRAPEHPAILCNHAMNLLIAGKDAEALEAIGKALSIEPSDKISQHVHDKILAVMSGEEARPTYKVLT